ncbi:hypothetical protein [Clostridium septicum]|uniref:Uncharacterized protein n=1 Tax=Clostridium septicum TaxID=1504 RepID=A0ABY5B3M3_CLOSE|nr:hypothetical protein [Clostridium septicum]UEC19677.1 hypothetical protein LK444_09610 [Clostridium septicum]USS02262.1 hypothetical protein NH397_07565 [Clostridium septicum]WLF70842.1 hypothetical protein Q6375_07660 [Clostridium septicum]
MSIERIQSGKAMTKLKEVRIKKYTLKQIDNNLSMLNSNNRDTDSTFTFF